MFARKSFANIQADYAKLNHIVCFLSCTTLAGFIKSKLVSYKSNLTNQGKHKCVRSKQWESKSKSKPILNLTFCLYDFFVSFSGKSCYHLRFCDYPGRIDFDMVLVLQHLKRELILGMIYGPSKYALLSFLAKFHRSQQKHITFWSQSVEYLRDAFSESCN